MRDTIFKAKSLSWRNVLDVETGRGFGNFCVNLRFFPTGVGRNRKFTQTISTPVDVFIFWHNISRVFMVKLPCDKCHMS